MKPLPYTIRVRPASAGSAVQEVLCRQMLRLMADRRETFAASWDGREVILKVFGHPWKARLHARRERRGFQRLGQLGIAAPAVLLHGRTEDGRWAVVTEKIEGAMTLLEARKAAHEARQRKVLLDLAGRELARLHGVGVLQEDLHPGNFLVRNDRLVALDPGQIRFLGRPVGRTASIRQLAQLARILVPGDQADAIETVRAGYVAARRWSWGHPETALFWRCFVRGRRGAIRATARRPLYKGRDHVRIRTRNCLVVAQKAFSDAGDLGGLVENLDALMEAGHVLRRGGGTLVSRFEWARQDVTATRFADGALAWRRNGRRCWVAARRLSILNIGVPRPLALVEKRRTGLSSHSYLLTKTISGPILPDFLRDGQVSLEDKRAVVRQVLAVLERLARYDITLDGLDLKAILVVDDRPVFAACRDVTIHRWPARFRRRYREQLRKVMGALTALGAGPEALGVPVALDEMPRFA